MQVKLWSKNEADLKEIAKEPEFERLGISVSKIANLALAQYVVTRKSLRPKKKK